MKFGPTWFIVVRLPPKEANAEGYWINPSGETCFYPPDGFPISAFADREQAERYVKAGSSQKEIHKVIPVVRKESP